MIPAPPALAPRPPVTLEQLRTAYGQIRDGWVGPAEQIWRPVEPVITVLGCHGGAGASLLALALATAASGTARVLECADPAVCGLAGTTTAELGADPDRAWCTGTRGPVTVQRRLERTANRPPMPGAARYTLTVLDVAAAGPRPAWLEHWLRVGAARVVLVSTATTYGMRRLEAAAASLPASVRPLAAIRGPAPRRWPAVVEVGPTTRRLLEARDFVTVPQEKSLVWAGLETGPVPRPLLAAARALLERWSATDPSRPEGDPS